MASQIETEQAQQNIALIRNMLEEDLAGFGDNNAENIASIRELINSDINAMGKQDNRPIENIDNVVRIVLENREKLKNELVVLDTQIAKGDDVENAMIIRDILIKDIADVNNEINSLNEYLNLDKYDNDTDED